MNLVTDARLVFVVYCWLNTCHRKLTTNSIVNINVQESQNSVYMAVVWLKCIQSVKWWAGMANIERYTTQVLRNSRNSKLFPLSTVLILCCFLMQEYWLMYWCTVEIELSSNVILYLTWPLSMSLHFVVTRHILTKQGVSCMHCVSLSTRVIL